VKAVVENIAARLGCSVPQARMVLDVVLLAIQQHLAERRKLLLRNFGTFEQRAQRLVFRSARVKVKE